MELKIKIDWSELDLFGHVNNVAFFKYIQSARIQFCEKLGLTLLNEPDKLSFMVASSTCHFKKPLMYPGEIKVQVKNNWIKNSSFQLSYKILNHHNELVAEAEDVLVVYNYAHKTKTEIPSDLRRILENNAE